MILQENITPSIFAADFSKIKDEIAKIEKYGCKMIHLDIMDGNFVPNISFGPKITEDILKITNLIFDAHLMVNDPIFYMGRFLFDKIKYITFHYESIIYKDKILNLIKKIKAKDKKAGISIKPETDIKSIMGFLKDLDLVLIMTVEPGFSGQKMIKEALPKIVQLNKIRIENNFNFLIQVDGGINFENASSIIDMGADLLVIGSAFFN